MEDNKPKRVVKASDIEGTVKTNGKKGLFATLTGIFIAEDVDAVKDYVMKDVIWPTIRDGIYDAFTGALSMFLYKTPTGRGGKRAFKNPGSSGYSPYGTIYTGSAREFKEDRPRAISGRRDVRDYESIRFAYRKDAETVLADLFDIFEDYEILSVADFYTLCKQPTTPIDHEWGWTDLNTTNVYVGRDHGEYYIHLPKPISIK